MKNYIKVLSISIISLFTATGFSQTYKIVDTDVIDYYNNNSVISINLKPHDTIYVEETNWSKFVFSSNLPSIILSILNIAITLERTN